jgi:hypothetical protein
MWGTRKDSTVSGFRFALGGGENKNFIGSVADQYIQEKLGEIASRAPDTI